jgi:DNA-binding response OmpR family regulator
MARILLVNDEPDLLALSSMVLESAGHTVETTIEGDKVLGIARQFRPDVIGMDWVIPDLPGTDVLRRLKSTTDTRSIPVIVISALEGLDDEAHRLGAQGVLKKPFRADELIAAIDGALPAARKPG